MRALVQAVWPQRGERGRLALSVLLSAGATGAAIALLSSSGYLISRAAQRPQMIALMVTIVAVRAFGIARAAFRYSERLASHDLALRQLARLRSGFFARLAPLVPGGLRGRRHGELLATFVGDVDALQDAHLRVSIPALVALVVIAGAGVAGWLLLGPGGGIAMLAALGIAALASALLSGAVAAATGRNQAPARAKLTSELIEAVDGSAELASAGAAAQHASRLRASDGTLRRLAHRDALAGALASGAQSLLTGAGLVVVLIVGIDAVRSGSMSAVLLAAVAFLFLGATETVATLPLAARRLLVCRTSAVRLQSICAEAPATIDLPSPLRIHGGGGLALDDVSVSYGEEELFEHVNLRLEPGEHTALTGPSGIGKTTLAELLVRFHDPTAGRVTLDGIDVRVLASDDLRAEVLLCAQDAHLFNTSIRENLLIACRTASDHELWSSLAAVELDAWVAGLPDGLETLVGQQGELVSGGQRQRLALARALCSGARVLILDEPVAHLDAALGDRVMRNVLAHAHQQTVLAITHATDTLEPFDRVLRLEHGRLRTVREQTSN